MRWRIRVCRRTSRGPAATAACSPCQCCARGMPIGAIVVDRRRVRTVFGQTDRAAEDLRRPGRHRHRERPPVQGAAGADGRTDPVGREADGPGRGQPGGQLDTRRRDGARHDRLPSQPARGSGRLRHLRVRRRRRRRSISRATHNWIRVLVETLRAAPLRKGEGAMGRAAETREPIQVADIAAPGAYQSRIRDTLLRAGYRALLSVPLLREERSSAACH